jgi:hypothetical protein
MKALAPVAIASCALVLAGCSDDLLDLPLRGDARAFARLTGEAAVEGLTKVEYEVGSTGTLLLVPGAEGSVQ